MFVIAGCIKNAIVVRRAAQREHGWVVEAVRPFCFLAICDYRLQWTTQVGHE